MEFLPKRLLNLVFERNLPAPTLTFDTSKFGRSSYQPPMVLPHRVQRCTRLHAMGLVPPGAYRHKVFGQEIRVGYMDVEENPLADYDYLGDGDGTLGSYIDAMYSSAVLYGLWYNSFGLGSSYRRQSSNFDLDLQSELRVGAHVSPEHDNLITLKLGTFLAIEDAAHTIMSDPNSPFSDVLSGASTNVLRMPNHNQFDQSRLLDYTHLFSIYQDQSLLSAYKLLPGSFDRQGVADYLANISTYWIIAHEDAHSYLGHLGYYAKNHQTHKLEAASFSELSALFLDTELQATRRAAEFDADRNAAIRLVDVFLDRAVITDMPAVFKDEARLLRNFCLNCDSFDKLQTLLLLRVILNAAVMGLVVLHKGCFKTSADMSSYPTLSERITNVVLAICIRTLQVSDSFDQRGLVGLTTREIYEVLCVTEYEIHHMLHIVFLNSTVYADPDMENADLDRLFPIAQNSDGGYLARVFLDALGFGQNNAEFFNPLERSTLKGFVQTHIDSLNLSLKKFWQFRNHGRSNLDELNEEDWGFYKQLLGNLTQWSANCESAI